MNVVANMDDLKDYVAGHQTSLSIETLPYVNQGMCLV
jgi:hypothetical protein